MSKTAFTVQKYRQQKFQLIFSFTDLWHLQGFIEAPFSNTKVSLKHSLIHMSRNKNKTDVMNTTALLGIVQLQAFTNA